MGTGGRPNLELFISVIGKLITAAKTKPTALEAS